MKLIAARLKRLPRAAYWIAGAIIACAGALGARFLADTFPLQQRVPIWLAGAGLVFIGLCVVSLGTRNHLEPDGPDEEQTVAETPEPAPAASAKDTVEEPTGNAGKAASGSGWSG